jgi:hypothetical protein
METKIEVIGVDGIARLITLDMPRQPGFGEISAIVNPYLQVPGKSAAYMERVTVWHNGEYLDMFVDDMGAIKRLPVNEAATLIYHANMIAHAEHFEHCLTPDTSDWPKIHGVAVLFHRRVWF